MKTILVLGDGGFLAGHVTRRYLQRGWRVVSIGRRAGPRPASDNHVRYTWQLPHVEFRHLLAVEQPHLVVNAAGKASVPASMLEPLGDFQASTLLNYEVLDDLRRRSPQTIFINLSSAAIYGDPVILPIAETASAAPLSPYGTHKQMTEMVLEQHARLFGMRTASLRIFSAYGPELHRQVVWDLACRALSEAVAKRGEPMVLHGRPEDTRDFIHGADVAAAVEAVVDGGALQGETYNVAGGIETPVRDVAAMVLKCVGSPAEIRFDSVARPGNPSRWHADISCLRRLGFAPTISLDVGIAQVVTRAAARGHE